MVSRKRGREEMETSGPEPAKEPTMLDRLRNTWEFANLMQYIYLFGKAVKIDEDLDIDDLEHECLKPEKSQVLNEIGLTLLKFVSSHRGLTPEIFDEYTRRQYMAKAPQRNPFGEEEEPKKFVDFDVFLKLKVLVQLSQWTLMNPDRMRERMPEVKENDQTVWRIEEIGWDRHDRSYFVLDDNRLYRRTDPAPPPPPVSKAKPKSTSKKGKAAARASKRRRTAELEEAAEDADVDTGAENLENEENISVKDEGFGGRKWECVAVTLGQYQDFLASMQKSRDPEEKAMQKRITETVLPEIEKLEASQVRKKQKQERELLNLQKLATAKRSSRLEAKFERERQEQEAVEAERKKREDLAAAKRDQEKQKAMEEARESRMMTREQRLKDREFKRLLHEEELTNLSEENKRVEAGESQRSERHLKAEMEKKKKDLAALEEEEDWVFDCAKCGIHGTNLDDGSPSIACERCNVWQHTACLGFTQQEAEKDDFHFICRDCKRREEDSKKPKIPSLKFHIGSSSSPPQNQAKVVLPAVNGVKRKSGEGALPPTKKFKTQEPHPGPLVNGTIGSSRPAHPNQNGMHATVMNGPQLSPQGQVKAPLYAGNTSPPPGATSFAKAPGYTSRDVLSSWSVSPSGVSQRLPKATGSHTSKLEESTKSKKPKPQTKPKPSPPDIPYETHKYQSYNYQHPHNSSPPLQGSYQAYQNEYLHRAPQESHQAYQNGHPYQAPHSSYNHNQNGHQPQPGVHSGYQAYGPFAQHNGPAIRGWSTHYAPPHPTSSHNVPPYAPSHPSQPKPDEYPLTSQGSSNSHKPSTSSNSRPTSSHSATTIQDQSLSAHVVGNYNNISPMKDRPPMSSTQYSAPALTPGAPAQIPQINGNTNVPISSPDPAAQSPVKQASPITSFNHPPASSPISNQPPLQATNAPTSPGFSPQKHSPPPQPSAQGHSMSAAPPAVLPPAPKLSPSPPQKPSAAPSKHEVPSHEDMSGENASAPVLSPSPTPQDLASPTKQTPLLARGSPRQPIQQQVKIVNGHESF